MSAELQELVYNTLNSQGMLGSIKAQIRSQMYQIINQSDHSIQKENNFQYQHPLIKKMVTDQNLKNTLDLIYDFLEHYQMEYTLSVFKEETQIIKTKNDNKSTNKLYEIVSNFNPNDLQNNNTKIDDKQQNIKSKTSSSITNNVQKQEPMNNDLKNNNNKSQTQINQIQPKKQQVPAILGGSSNQITGASNNNIKGFGTSLVGGLSKKDPYSFDIEEEEKNINNSKPNLLQQQNQIQQKQQPQANSNKIQINNNNNNKQQINKKQKEEEMFDEIEIDEDIIEDIDDLEQIDNKNDKKLKQNMHTSSEDIMISQSQGYDMSVDSMALEEYDYYENVQLAR